MAHQREMNRIQSGVNEISPTLDRIHAADTELLDWLQEQIVDTIYLDDGRIIDVCGGNLRVAIAVAKAKNPSQETS
jgi:ubiquinone/menaquinone biosynthesis C-methylase UbiE